MIFLRRGMKVYSRSRENVKWISFINKEGFIHLPTLCSLTF